MMKALSIRVTKSAWRCIIDYLCVLKNRSIPNDLWPYLLFRLVTVIGYLKETVRVRYALRIVNPGAEENSLFCGICNKLVSLKSEIFWHGGTASHNKITHVLYGIVKWSTLYLLIYFLLKNDINNLIIK